LEAAGFGGLAAEPPVLDALAEQARHCWHFCGGWAPQSWLVYGALFEVADWHLLIELMQEIRSNV
jgi:hypothetical protein